MGNHDLSKLSVLVVEKSPLIRRLIGGVLGVLGIRDVAEATSPDKGFRAFVARPADLVLVDWSADFNGLDLLYRIRRDPRSPDPRAAVIVMRSNDNPRHIISARDAGMTNLLPMPLTVRTLFECIQDAVENDRPFVQCGAYVGPDRRRRTDPYLGSERRHHARAEGMAVPAS